MITFKDFYTILEADSSGKAAIMHLSHLDDLVIERGVDGLKDFVSIMNELLDIDLLPDGDVKVSVKFDGCVREDTVVLTSVGDITIKELIERIRSGEKIETVGKDFDDNIDKNTHISNTAISDPNKNWVKITTENNEDLFLTEDHEIHTSNKGWVEAKDIQPDDDITEL